MTSEETETFYSYGFAQYGAGNWTEAADTFRILCLNHPLEQKFWFGLGASLQEAGSYHDALKSWAMAALLDEKDPYPHFHAAECCLSLKKVEDAALALKESASRMQEADPLYAKIGILKKQWSLI